MLCFAHFGFEVCSLAGYLSLRSLFVVLNAHNLVRGGSRSFKAIVSVKYGLFVLCCVRLPSIVDAQREVAVGLYR